jgi:hypothetical protein
MDLACLAPKNLELHDCNTKLKQVIMMGAIELAPICLQRSHTPMATSMNRAHMSALIVTLMTILSISVDISVTAAISLYPASLTSDLL